MLAIFKNFSTPTGLIALERVHSRLRLLYAKC
jgi:hypothetical protein